MVNKKLSAKSILSRRTSRKLDTLGYKSDSIMSAFNQSLVAYI